MRKTKNVLGLGYRARWGAVAVVATAACTGAIGPLAGDTPGGDGGTTSSGTTAGGTTAGGTTAGGTPGDGGVVGNNGGDAGTQLGSLPPGPLDDGRVTMRRLNVREYDNTMRDLLGTTQTLAANNFPGDGADDGFDTVGDALSYSDLLFADEFSAAATLVTELTSRAATDPLYKAVFSCTPTAANLSTCMTTVLTAFMPKAWRRPVTSAEVTAAVAVATAVMQSAGTVTAGDAGAAASPMMAGVSAALQYVLTSPNFLFHVELGDPQITPASTATTPLSPYEVASRLSYFLWSSMPDATLTQLAASGQLINGTGVSAQVTRMVADAKFSSFLNGYVGQWIGTENVALVAPDPTMFPNASAAWQNAIAPETDAFLQNLISTNAPLTDLLLANYTYVNGALAQFYGLSGVPATQTTFTQASLAGTQRLGGVLTQETFLTTTSFPTRTSPVKRGEYVMAQIICNPPQPPPPNVPSFVQPEGGTGITVREALDEHASNTYCASCHNQIDPIGFTFENFDATGAYRTVDNGSPIDSSGSLYGVNGAAVTGAQGMAQAIAADPRFPECMVKQAMTYAIGRTFDTAAALGYVETVAAPLTSGGQWQGLLQTVANSQGFLTTRGGT
jgi:hypothetical protein